MPYPESLDKCIEYFKKFPGVGEKSAERLALAALGLSKEEIKEFSDTLLAIKNNLHKCHICGHLTDKDECDICTSDNRDKSLICVLEDYKSVFSFEKIGNYRGVYHVLDGLISPIDGVRPEDLNIASLIKRVENLKKCELIIALKSSIEGETTTLYIKKIFENKPIEISRLSYGIPVGAEIDYLDSITLDRAIDDRKKIA